MIEKIIISSIIIGGLILGYLVSVGIVAILQILVNAIFDTSYAFDIWLGGLLFYIIWQLLKNK